MNVDIWSDLTCPWCYIGKRRFETALESSAHRDAVEVRWRSFQLDPAADTRPSLTLPERHHQDFGGSLEAARERIATVASLAAESGLDYDLDRALPVNTFDAHRVIHHAQAEGAGDAVRERLMRAYVAEGAVLSDHRALVALAAECGLDAAGTREVLAGTAYADAVRADQALAERWGVTGVPTFVFDERFAASGAQPVEAFAKILATVAQPVSPGD